MITAIGGILALVLSNGPSKKTTLANWATQANQICQDAGDEIRALGVPTDQTLPQSLRITTRANARVQALDRPTQGQKTIDQVLALASQEDVAIQNASNALRVGDSASAQGFYTDAKRLASQVQQLDGQLGANVCASP